MCVQRGGCFNCTAGEYDGDGDPAHLRAPRPKGETSPPGATKGADCHESEQGLLVNKLINTVNT